MSDEWSNREATYASECSECEHYVTIDRPVSAGDSGSIWGWCGNCGHMNWLQKQT